MSLKTVGTVTFHYGACKNCVHRNNETACDVVDREFHYFSSTVECADYLSIDESEE